MQFPNGSLCRLTAGCRGCRKCEVSRDFEHLGGSPAPGRHRTLLLQIYLPPGRHYCTTACPPRTSPESKNKAHPALPIREEKQSKSIPPPRYAKSEKSESPLSFVPSGRVNDSSSLLTPTPRPALTRRPPPAALPSTPPCHLRAVPRPSCLLPSPSTSALSALRRPPLLVTRESVSRGT